MMRNLIPGFSNVAFLVNPANPFVTETMSKEMQAAAGTLGLQLHILQASSEQDFANVFATLAGLRAGALLIAPDSVFISNSAELGALTLAHAVPAITQFREFAAGGGLMSYGGACCMAGGLARAGPHAGHRVLANDVGRGFGASRRCASPGPCRIRIRRGPERRH